MADIDPPKTPSSDSAHFEVNEWPFYWLLRAYRQYQSTMEEELRAIELDVPTWRVLMLLEGEEALSVSLLAREAISKLSTMTRIIHRMEKDDLITTRSSAADRRVTEVLLTQNGRRARRLAWKLADEIYSKAFRDFDPEMARTLTASLKLLHANLLPEE